MEFLIAVLIFAITTGITPGPNNIMIMTSGLNFGVRNSLPHYLGICFGFPAMVVLIGFGFGFVFDKYPILHLIIRIAGITYLLYLSWVIANAAPNSFETKNSKPLSFLQAVLFQWVNPKAWIMATGSIAAFTTPASDIYLQILTIALIFFLLAFITTGTWLFFGVWLQKFLKDPSHQRVFNVTMAVLLVLSITPSTINFVSEYLSL
jgi:threonine/homoserine/homoserine lactone efflux protein